MKRKLIKYTKFVVSVALIISLIAPSYAALSASDGSAFVTKAEFDSALADFNSRLTTFEAGINSKIDSQVTSYLDRNGIWSGKKQDLIWNFYDLGDSTHKDWSYVCATLNGKVETASGEMIITKYPLVNSVNKSGLMYALLEFGKTPGTGLVAYLTLWLGRGTGEKTNAWEYGLTYGWGLLVERGGADIILSASLVNQLTAGQPSATQTYGKSELFSAYQAMTQSLVFVTQYDKLIFFTWHQFSSGHATCFMQNTHSEADQIIYNYQQRVIVKELQVY